VDFLRPQSWADALAAKAEHPAAVPIAGGTDLMVELNFDHRRPDALLDLNPVRELAGWDVDGDHIRIGAGLPYSRLIAELGDRLPGLAMASRTVGSPQIRNRGTVGGNLGTASPAGDTHPALLACTAQVEAASVRGTRLIPIEDFYLGVKRNALAGDELIAAVHLPSADGPQQFAKVGTRNAMVIAVCAFALRLSPGRESVGAALGSSAPTPRSTTAAVDFLTGELAAHNLWHSRNPLPENMISRFGELVAGAAAPIDDVRGSAAYRRHALAVLARRTLGWAWQEYRRDGEAACA
jgi:CO/xanthine dehydrogenase FAD-binding subunit